MRKTPSAAIVTTLRDAASVIDSFIKYHLSIGFDHIFLFFDDPADPSIAKARKYTSVTCIRNGRSLRRLWKETRSYKSDDTMRFINSEVMARQELNAEAAIMLCRQREIDWLLHIDIDELFFPTRGTVKEHFKALCVRRVRHIKYVNYEAIPQHLEISDYFKEITLFKKPPQRFSGGWFSEAQTEVIRSIPQLPENLFLFYANGKSAARVADDLVPCGVHAFRSLGAKPRSRFSQDAVILHYPCCGFEHFWRKYRALGRFADKWFDSIDIAGTGNTFHLEARDVVMRNNRAAAKKFYESRVVLRNPEFIDRLLENDLCCIVSEPSRLISATSLQG